ncbi:hypothetical protein SAMN04487901_106111 [Prevotella communis]|uniref:CDP-Glycerol:Poly(Glycerophosphate) glycerophosphotransferase n=1 Tax=Prevotella communis TaxID=2913614 RepID=A0A1G7VT60_9BACT|nr:hypothetical protein [Prevotella communis]SDG62761.1 hypothetical protein SAMN04487901_106111 [Prevotella communis]
MKYLEGVELIRQIEDEYDVMSIKYKDISAWSYLRLYLLDRITANRENKASRSIIAMVLKSLFFYNPFHLFRHYDVWMFTGSERRKRIGDKMIHRVSGGASTSIQRCLMVEKPSKPFGHYCSNCIQEKNIVSEAWLLMTFRIIELLLRPFHVKVENEELLKQILREKNLDYNYKHYLRLLNAQRVAMRLMLGIIYKPKVVLMESPYDSMGYMWAFHQTGVKVIELQHGVLNRNHNAYNAIAYERQMNPDCICVFGEEEFKYFTKEKPSYAPVVKMTGLYMLELADLYFNSDPFSEYRKKFNRVIVAAGQSNAEKELSEFVDSIARENNDIFFIYIPRESNADVHFSTDNAILKTGVNIYEYLKWADIHMTISSTTCLEAHYFHTPTIFVDLNRLATEYYGDILSNKNGAVYITTKEEFVGAAQKLDDADFEWKELFAHHHTEKIKKIVEDELAHA